MMGDLTRERKRRPDRTDRRYGGKGPSFGYDFHREGKPRLSVAQIAAMKHLLFGGPHHTKVFIRLGREIRLRDEKRRMWEPYKADPNGRFIRTVWDTRPSIEHQLTPVWDALRGHEAAAKLLGMDFKADLGSVGRLKAHDPLLNRTYDLSAGEQAPGLRPGGGYYTPEEFEEIQARLATRPSLSALEREALSRVARAGSRAIRPNVGGL